AEGFDIKEAELQEAVQIYIETKAEPTGLYKLRGALNPSGRLDLSHAPIDDAEEASAIQNDEPISAPPEFIENKTTVGYHYKIPNNDFNIVLYYNGQQQLTDFNIGNVVISENGELYTPSEQTGILKGVMRQSLLDDKTIREKDYSLDDFIGKYKEIGRASC